jgi:Alr-MurF fusion protein
LNLAVDVSRLIQISKAEVVGTIPADFLLNSISVDTRKIIDGFQVVFYALQGEFKDGHDFIKDAYSKGVRVFVVTKKPSSNLENACFLVVKEALTALQALAKHHRDQFQFPVIAITGSVGKTTTKEWLYHLLSTQFRIIRSPKSYNSQLGVALSLLELNEDCDVAIIEVGISRPGEMEVLEKMVSPEIAVLTNIGTAHLENFKDFSHLCMEKSKLFSRAKKIFLGPGINPGDFPFLNEGEAINMDTEELRSLPFNDAASKMSATIAIAIAKFLKVPIEKIMAAIPSLPRLAMRLETYEGVNNNLIINDTYNLDLDALKHSLEFQASIANKRPRVLIIGLHEQDLPMLEKIYSIAKPFNLNEIHVMNSGDEPSFTFENSVVLIKGTRKSNMQTWAMHLKRRKHKTQIEVNLSALRHNLIEYKESLQKQTKILVMVKAQAYGSGLVRIAQFIEKTGVDYLGVAYVDEGVELRKAGVLLPILVMNAEEEAFGDCINYNLEPAIYSFEQLDALLHQLIAQSKEDFPVHLKFDTGMNRLGFLPNEVRKLVDIIRSQPEISIKSVYSHLAESDNKENQRFTLDQIERFSSSCEQIKTAINQPFLRHILNSDGIVNFGSNQFDMVRMGIGVFGISTNSVWKKKLQPVIAWKSTVSQLKKVSKGQSVGYNRTFIASKDLTIAVIPVGYGDGYRRSLSNGKGGVFIQGVFCATVGNVCMDMIMVDVTHIKAKSGDEVEIIGPNQQVETLAIQMGTIPYELLTGISQRVHRSYINED